VPEELVRRQTDIFHDLAKERRGDVPPSMNRYRCSPAVLMPKLLVGAALPYLLKAEGPEDSDDLTRTQDRDLAHG
jgi:hypothetical protein